MISSNGLWASKAMLDNPAFGSYMLPELIGQATGLSPTCAKLLLFM
jgi:hypothetical protein